MSTDRVRIFDTTLRDGEQSPGCSMTPPEKLVMARQLERLGVDVIEAGFAIASPGEIESIQAIARVVRGATIASLARTKKADIDAARRALAPARRARCHVFIATSDIHLKYKLRMSRAKVLASAVEAVRYARGYFPEVEFSAEDATRSDIEFLAEVAQAVEEAGADVVNLPDTVGYIMPEEYGALFRRVRERAVKATLSAHCHNDLGMAVANSLAAVGAGARQVECTVNGIGERAGNASMEEIVMALYVRRDRFGEACGVKTQEIYPASQLLTRITGISVQPNKAVVGRNAFAHEAGIHQDGVLKHAVTYEIMTPQSVGRAESDLILGKHSGRHALARRYAELGHALDGAALDCVYDAFKSLADRKKVITDDDLRQVLRNAG